MPCIGPATCLPASLPGTAGKDSSTPASLEISCCFLIERTINQAAVRSSPAFDLHVLLVAGQKD